MTDSSFDRILTGDPTMAAARLIDSRPGIAWATPAALKALQVLERGEPEAQLELLTQQAGEATLAALSARTGWKPADILRIAKSLESKKRVMILGQPAGLVVHVEHFATLAKNVLEELEKFHTANPLVSGLPKKICAPRCLPADAPRPHPRY